MRALPLISTRSTVICSPSRIVHGACADHASLIAFGEGQLRDHRDVLEALVAVGALDRVAIDRQLRAVERPPRGERQLRPQRLRRNRRRALDRRRRCTMVCGPSAISKRIVDRPVGDRGAGALRGSTWMAGLTAACAKPRTRYSSVIAAATSADARLDERFAGLDLQQRRDRGAIAARRCPTMSTDSTRCSGPRAIVNVSTSSPPFCCARVGRLRRAVALLRAARSRCARLASSSRS